MASLLKLAISGIVVLCIAAIPRLRSCFTATSPQRTPISVNYFFSRKCNAACSFCFHTAKTSHIEGWERIRRGLRLLAEAGMKKINFAGGEPFLYPGLLGKMVRFCKEELRIESVSIVTNGSKVTERFLARHAAYIDILAVSCDSFEAETNARIGRTEQGRDWGNVDRLNEIADWCRRYGILFKMNTVVCRLNVEEDMSDHIARLQPYRWKVFQVLVVPGENDSDERQRNATDLQITNGEFERWCQRHEHLRAIVPESNRVMKSSYLLLDEYMCFLDKDKNVKSGSILDIGVQAALGQVHWDEEAFHERGGVYDWTWTARKSSSGASQAVALDPAKHQGGSIKYCQDGPGLDW